MPILKPLNQARVGQLQHPLPLLFYRDEQQNRDTYSYGMMTEETLETLIKKPSAYATRECLLRLPGGGTDRKGPRLL